MAANPMTLMYIAIVIGTAFVAYVVNGLVPIIRGIVAADGFEAYKSDEIGNRGALLAVGIVTIGFLLPFFSPAIFNIFFV